MADHNLKPCPFCGSKNIDAQGWASTDSAGPACDDCGASSGTVGNTLQENIDWWNHRAAPVGFGSLSPVDHVRYWAEAYGPQATEPHFQGHGMVAALLAEYADLLERLAACPQGVTNG